MKNGRGRKRNLAILHMFQKYDGMALGIFAEYKEASV